MFFLREIVNRFSYIDILLYISYLVFILQEYTFHLLAIAAVATRPGLGIGVNLPIYPGAKWWRIKLMEDKNDGRMG